jgi:hypothetical protein
VCRELEDRSCAKQATRRSFAELDAARIPCPAAVVSELKLNGYVMQRVYEHRRLVGVRLLEPEPQVTSWAPSWRMSHQWPTAVHHAITADCPGLV